MSWIPAPIRVFDYLSILTVGGGMAAFPEMKVLTVDVHNWLTFAIGQWVAGLAGAIAVLVAFFGPTALLALFVGCGRDLKPGHWRSSIQKGLAPVSIGLLLAGCFAMVKGAIFGVETAAVAVGALLILLQYKVNPALLVLGGAVVGVLSFAPK